MEPVVFKDSPLGLYLAGEGEGQANDDEWTPKETHTAQSTSSLQPSPFAPRGLPARPRRLRPKPPRLLTLERSPSKGAVARWYCACAGALNAKLGWAENGRFLEQFRYIVIASQLLNDVPSHGIYKRQITAPGPKADSRSVEGDEHIASFTWSGLSLTVLAAFALTWSIHWTRNVAQSTSRVWPLVLTPAVAITVCLILYAYFKRQWLHWIHSQAIESASTLVAGAQNLDAALSASISLIQEVELLVSSSPLPPISRLEEKDQTRRCARLRAALHRTFSSLSRSYHKAFDDMKSLTVEMDLEKYYDIYEISRSEMLELEESRDIDTAEFGEGTLKAFKVGSRKMQLARKLFFCSLLALSADGGKVDLAKWSTATRAMDDLSITTSKATQDVDELLGTEEGED
ncbi:MAG: hypothetical protein Q9219_002719 [cf. Caloplaca sp. 3 TL-2023]